LEITKKTLMKYTLVTQSFGKENEYKRAILLLWSFWAVTPKPLPVLLFTDNPEYFYPYVSDMPVTFVSLSEDKIREMRGGIDFLHRMKIYLIEESFKKINDIILYADSDTFFIEDPSSYVKRISSDQNFMHLIEYPFYELRNMPLPSGKYAHAFLDLIEKKIFQLSDGTILKIDPHLYSWNAGVMFLHPSMAKWLPDVYSLTDQFFLSTGNHASEQFAFSIVLQNRTKVNACNNVVYHYWYRVKKDVMDNWLSKTITADWAMNSFENKVKMIKDWVATLPGKMDNHAWMLRDNAIQAFHENRFYAGYKFAMRKIIKSPFDWKFIKDLMYHFKRQIAQTK
jgi:hypothetical protein